MGLVGKAWTWAKAHRQQSAWIAIIGTFGLFAVCSVVLGQRDLERERMNRASAPPPAEKAAPAAAPVLQSRMPDPAPDSTPPKVADDFDSHVAVRSFVAEKLGRVLIEPDKIDSVYVSEKDKDGPTLMIRGHACAPRLVDEIAASDAGASLWRHGFRKVECRSGLLTYYEARIREPPPKRRR